MRRVYLNLKIALRALYSFKLRTALAVLGVFLGTCSLIVVYNLSASLSKKAEKEIESLGKDLLVARSGVVRGFGARPRLLSQATTLTLDDARAIAQGSPFISQVAPSSTKTFPVRYGNVALNAIIITGATANYQEVRNFYVDEGVFFTEENNEDLDRVVVLGRKVADKLFGNENPLGKYILIFRVPCQVIGVMEEKGVDLSGFDQDNQIFIPINTYLRRFVNQDFVNTIYVQVNDGKAMGVAKSQIEGILRERHKIRPDQRDDFGVIDSKDIAALQTQTTSMISILGRIAAGISFLIGALGILSIMILIVNERKLEIGLRRAVGSRKRDIVLQFLIESSFISLVGGAVGCLFGFLITLVIFVVSSLPFSASPAGFVISFAASVLVGVMAGIYPSQKATAVQPVNIIRSGG